MTVIVKGFPFCVGKRDFLSSVGEAKRSESDREREREYMSERARLIRYL